MRALGILNLPQQIAYNKGIFMHKVLNNNSPNYLAQLTSPTTSTPGITSTCQGQGLTYLKLAYPSLERPSGTPCLKIQNHVFLFFVSNVICTNICLRITFRQIWTDLFESNVCLKNLVLYAHERNLILMFLHICRNCETALINCLIVLIMFVCGIVVFICVCSIARTGC